MQSVKRDVKNIREPCSIITNKVPSHKCDFTHKIFEEFTVSYCDSSIYYKLNNDTRWIKVATFEQLSGGGKITCVNHIKCDNGPLLIVGAAAPNYGGYVWVIKLNCGKLITHCFYTSYGVTTLSSYYKPALSWAKNSTVILLIGMESCKMFILNITLLKSANNKQRLLEPVDRVDKIFRNSGNISTYFCYEIGALAHIRKQWHYLLPSGKSSGVYPGTVISSMELHEMMGAIVVGYSIGCWQIWGVSSNQTKLWFTSLYQPNMLPVTHSVLLEPENDPQCYIFLWVVHSKETPAVDGDPDTCAAIYQLQFKSKKDTQNGHQFERLTELVERFHFNLSTTLFIGHESGVFKRLIDFQMIKKPNMFQSCNDFNGVTIIIETTKYIITILFDLNAWYFFQLPSTVPPNAKLSPYIAFLPLNLSTIPKFCCLQGVKVLPESIFRGIESSSEACAIYPCSLNTTVRVYFGSTIIDALYLPDIPDQNSCDFSELSSLTLKGIFSNHNNLLMTKKGKGKLLSFLSTFLPDLKTALNEAIEPVLSGLPVASREIKNLQHLVSIISECYFLSKKVASKADNLTPLLFLHTHAYAKTILALTDAGVLPAYFDHLQGSGTESFPLPVSCISTLLTFVDSVHNMWDIYPPRSIRALLNIYYTKPLDITLQTLIVAYSLMHLNKPEFDLAELGLLKMEDCNMVKAMYYLDRCLYDKFIEYLPSKSQFMQYCSVDSLIDILIRGKRKDVALQMLMLLSLDCNKRRSNKIQNLLSTALSSENLLKLLENGSADSKTFECILEEQFTHSEFISILKTLDFQSQFDCLFYVTLRENKLCDLLSAYGEVQKTKKLSTSSFIEFMLEYTMRHFSDIELKSCLIQRSSNVVPYDNSLPLSAQPCQSDNTVLTSFCIRSDLTKLVAGEKTPTKPTKPISPLLFTPPQACDVSDELLMQLRTPHPTQTPSRVTANVLEGPRSILRSKKTEKKNRKRIRFGGDDEDICEGNPTRLSFGGADTRAAEVVSPEKKQKVSTCDPTCDPPCDPNEHDRSSNVGTSLNDTPVPHRLDQFNMTKLVDPTFDESMTDPVHTLDFSPVNPNIEDSFDVPSGEKNCSFVYSDDEPELYVIPDMDNNNSTKNDEHPTFADSTFGDEISFDVPKPKSSASFNPVMKVRGSYKDAMKQAKENADTSVLSAGQTIDNSMIASDRIEDNVVAPGEVEIDFMLKDDAVQGEVSFVPDVDSSIKIAMDVLQTSAPQGNYVILDDSVQLLPSISDETSENIGDPSVDEVDVPNNTSLIEDTSILSESFSQSQVDSSIEIEYSVEKKGATSIDSSTENISCSSILDVSQTKEDEVDDLSLDLEHDNNVSLGHDEDDAVESVSENSSEEDEEQDSDLEDNMEEPLREKDPPQIILSSSEDEEGTEGSAEEGDESVGDDLEMTGSADDYSDDERLNEAPVHVILDESGEIEEEEISEEEDLDNVEYENEASEPTKRVGGETRTDIRIVTEVDEYNLSKHSEISSEGSIDGHKISDNVVNVPLEVLSDNDDFEEGKDETVENSEEEEDGVKDIQVVQVGNLQEVDDIEDIQEDELEDVHEVAVGELEEDDKIEDVQCDEVDDVQEVEVDELQEDDEIEDVQEDDVEDVQEVKGGELDEVDDIDDVQGDKVDELQEVGVGELEEDEDIEDVQGDEVHNFQEEEVGDLEEVDEIEHVQDDEIEDIQEDKVEDVQQVKYDELEEDDEIEDIQEDEVDDVLDVEVREPEEDGEIVDVLEDEGENVPDDEIEDVEEVKEDEVVFIEEGEHEGQEEEFEDGQVVQVSEADEEDVDEVDYVEEVEDVEEHDFDDLEESEVEDDHEGPEEEVEDVQGVQMGDVLNGEQEDVEDVQEQDDVEEDEVGKDEVEYVQDVQVHKVDENNEIAGVQDDEDEGVSECEVDHDHEVQLEDVEEKVEATHSLWKARSEHPCHIQLESAEQEDEEEQYAIKTKDDELVEADLPRHIELEYAEQKEEQHTDEEIIEPEVQNIESDDDIDETVSLENLSFEEPNLPTPAESESNDDARSLDDHLRFDQNDSDKPPTPARSDSNDDIALSPAKDETWVGFEENSPWGSEENTNPWVLEESDSSVEATPDQVGTLLSPEKSSTEETDNDSVENFNFASPVKVSDVILDDSDTSMSSPSFHSVLSRNSDVIEPVSVIEHVDTSMSSPSFHTALSRNSDVIEPVSAIEHVEKEDLLEKESSAANVFSSFSINKYSMQNIFGFTPKPESSLPIICAPPSIITPPEDVPMEDIQDDFEFSIPEHVADVQVSEDCSENINFDFTSPTHTSINISSNEKFVASPSELADTINVEPVTESVTDIAVEDSTITLQQTPPKSKNSNPEVDVASDRSPNKSLSLESMKTPPQLLSTENIYKSVTSSPFSSPLTYLISPQPLAPKYKLRKCSQGQYKLESTHQNKSQNVDGLSVNEMISAPLDPSPKYNIIELLENTTEQPDLLDRDISTETPARMEIFTSDDRPVEPPAAATRSRTRNMPNTIVIPAPEMEPILFVSTGRTLRSRKTAVVVDVTSNVSKSLKQPGVDSIPEPVPDLESPEKPKIAPSPVPEKPKIAHSTVPEKQSMTVQTQRIAEQPINVSRSSKRIRQKQLSSSSDSAQPEPDLSTPTRMTRGKRKMMKKCDSSDEKASKEDIKIFPKTPSPPAENLDQLPRRSTRSTRKAVVKKVFNKEEETPPSFTDPIAARTRKSDTMKSPKPSTAIPDTAIPDTAIPETAIPGSPSTTSIAIPDSPSRTTRRKRTQLKFSDETPAEEVRMTRNRKKIANDTNVAAPTTSLVKSKRMKKVLPEPVIEEPDAEISPLKKGRKNKKTANTSEAKYRVTRSTRKVK